MGEVRACVYFSVFLLCFQFGIASPMFGTRFWCDLLCDDDDISTTTTASTEDDYYDWCTDCPVRRPRTTTTRAPPTFGPMQPVNFMIPPGGNGMNLSWNPNPNPNQGGWWGFYFSPNTATPTPGGRPQVPPIPPIPPIPAIPTPPSAPAVTVTPGGVTPAPGAATTPAGTTAAPTTAAAGK